MVATLDGTPRRGDQHVATQVRRRRRAAVRLPPLLDSGLRDPLLEQPGGGREPCTFGLSTRELLAEARRLRARGWEPWEIELTLSLPHAGDAR